MWKIIENTNSKYEWDTTAQKIRERETKRELLSGYTPEGQTYVLRVGTELMGIKVSDIKEPEEEGPIIIEAPEEEPIKGMTPSALYRKECDKRTYSKRLKGYEVDHKVPVSFCRKMGLTPEECCVDFNLQYLTPEKNLAKFSFVKYEDAVLLMKELGLSIDITKKQVNRWNVRQSNRKKSFVVKVNK